MSTTPNDPLFKDQWHLRNDGQSGGTAGVDINVLPAWADYTGQGVRIAIFDEGVQGDHPDLAANFDTTDGYDTESGKTGPGLPVHAGDNHGTVVAGFAAEVGNNGIGGTGVAYDATIISYRQLFGSDDEDELDDDDDDTTEYDGFEQQLLQGVDVSNNSWGGTLIEAQDPDNAEIVARLATEGRDGLGSVIVFAGGNERHQTMIASAEGDQSAPHVISVGAIDHDGRASWFSNPGAGLLVVAPGQDVLSTDRSPPFGYNPDDEYVSDSGTSFAAPIVSGVVALMLEANPLLGARDVQQILAASAWQPDGADSWMRSTDDIIEVLSPHLADDGGQISEDDAQAYLKPWDWQVNGAANWNGGGYHVSHDYGMGLVDAHAAVRFAESWGKNAQTFANQKELSFSDTTLVNLPSGMAQQYDVTFADADGVTLEHLTLRLELPLAVDATLADLLAIYEALDITLTSPDGTVSYLMTGFDAELWARYADEDLDLDMVLNDDGESLDIDLGTTQHWGEAATGVWTVQVANQSADAMVVALEGMTLEAQGAAPSLNNIYLFTNEYAELVAADPSRALLADRNGGQDTVNFAPLASDLEIWLDGTSGLVGETAWGLAENIRIEHAIGGDGNDQIHGNDENNWLRGMRGDDVLHGGAGNDRLEGGAGNDQLFGGSGENRLFGGDGDDILRTGNDGSLLSGGRGNDEVYGGDGNDTLYGFAGDDRLEGGLGDDILDGGKGDDIILGGDGDDLIISGFGNDQIDGGAGTDTLQVDFLSSTYRLEGTSEQGRLIDLGLNDFNRGIDTFTSIELVQFTDQTLGWNGTSWAAVAV